MASKGDAAPTRTVRKNGQIEWRDKEGKLHRVEGPALEVRAAFGQAQSGLELGVALRGEAKPMEGLLWDSTGTPYNEGDEEQGIQGLLLFRLL